MGVILLIVGVGAILVFLLSPPKRDNPKFWDEDREPRREDFTDDIAYGGKTALQKFEKAHYAWVQRKMRQIVYELPIEEALKRDDLALYLMETSKRNRSHIRDEGSRLNDTYRACCQVCGSGNVRHGHQVRLCDDCYAMMEAASREGSDYKLPLGAQGFSVELWTHHMAIALDLETGVIDEAQAQRELRIIVELERRRIEREEQRQQREADKKQREAQRSINIANAANRLR